MLFEVFSVRIREELDKVADELIKVRAGGEELKTDSWMECELSGHLIDVEVAADTSVTQDPCELSLG